MSTTLESVYIRAPFPGGKQVGPDAYAVNPVITDYPVDQIEALPEENAPVSPAPATPVAAVELPIRLRSAVPSAEDLKAPDAEIKPHPVREALARNIGRPALTGVAHTAAFITESTDALLQFRKFDGERFRKTTTDVNEHMLGSLRNWSKHRGIGWKMLTLAATILPVANFGLVETGEVAAEGGAMDMAREHVTNYWEQLGIGTAAAMVSALAAEGLINAIIRLKNKSLQQEKIAAGKKVEPLTTRERIAGFVYGFACGSPWAVKRGQMVEGKDIAVAMGGYQTYVLARSGLVAFGAGEVANSWPVAAGVATFLGWCATVGATHDTLGQETGLGRKIDTALHWTQRTIAGVDDTGRKRFERKLAGAEAFEINPDHAGRRAKIAQAVLDHRLSRVA